MKYNNYTAYHVHSWDSLLDSCTDFRDYADRAAELGQKALAITEHGVTYNWIEKKMYINSKGLKYIHGVECYLTASLEDKVRDNYHTILLAKNYKGVQEINLLVDKSTQPDHRYYKPRITFDEFFNISDNVIKISACLASPLNKYPNDINKSIQEQTFELNKKMEEKIKEIECLKQDKKKEAEWVKEYNDDPTPPWYYDGTPHEAWIKYLDKKINSYRQKYEEEINTVKEINDSSRKIFYKLLDTYDYYEIQPHDFPEQK